MQKCAIIGYLEQSVAYTIYDTKWIPSSARVLVSGAYARQTGVLNVLSMDNGKLTSLKEFEKPHAIKCSTFGACDEFRRVVVGDFKGNLSMYDLETGQSSWSVAGHSLIVNSVDGCGGLASPGGAPEVVSGARDGCVRVWDPRVKEAVAAMEPESREAARDCWAVAFGNNFGEERCVAAGFDNGDVKMFDLRTNTVVWETNVSNGVCAIEFDRKDIEMNKMVVGALEANFAVYDLRTRSAEEGFAHLTEKGAHKGSTVWQCRHLPQKRDVFATTGGNGSINVYKYKYPVQRFKVNAETGDRTGVMGTLEELASTTLSTQPIASFDWSADKEGLCVMGSFDQTVRVAIVTNLGTEGQ